MVSHSKTGGTKAMTEAVVAGANHPDIEGVEVVQVTALEATPDDVMAADGYLLGTPENFGYMSGALKHFFDTVYYDCLDHTRGRPYGLFVRAGNDGTGAVAGGGAPGHRAGVEGGGPTGSGHRRADRRSPGSLPGVGNDAGRRTRTGHLLTPLAPCAGGHPARMGVVHGAVPKIGP